MADLCQKQEQTKNQPINHVLVVRCYLIFLWNIFNFSKVKNEEKNCPMFYVSIL